MDIELISKGESLTIVVDGNVDAENGRRLASTLQEAMDLKMGGSVTFDLTGVRSVTSTGIGKLLNFFKYLNGEKRAMCVKGISEQLYRQFMEIHLDRIFPIER
ncbi:MAG: STAS domain-containing protein [Spirochaetaceae bacterium]|nr:STAS domain-containing protein [Spirochaetaceae bacterium]